MRQHMQPETFFLSVNAWFILVLLFKKENKTSNTCVLFTKCSPTSLSTNASDLTTQ